MPVRAVLSVSALLFLLPASVPAADFYKCMVAGRTVYQSTPCAPGAPGAGDIVELAPINSMGESSGKGKRAPARPEKLPEASGTQVAPLTAGPDWHSGLAGYSAARDESADSGLPLLVYFYTDWCPYCRHFDARVLPDPAVRAELARFVKVRINADHGDRESALHRQLGGNGIPYVVVSRGGELVRVGGTGDVRNFVRALAAFADEKPRRR